MIPRNGGNLNKAIYTSWWIKIPTILEQVCGIYGFLVRGTPFEGQVIYYEKG